SPEGLVAAVPHDGPDVAVPALARHLVASPPEVHGVVRPADRAVLHVTHLQGSAGHRATSGAGGWPAWVSLLRATVDGGDNALWRRLTKQPRRPVRATVRAVRTLPGHRITTRVMDFG